MKISVICPTYNSSKFVLTTLESVLKQIKMPDELIISDDGSTDDTVDVIENYLKTHNKKLNYKIIKNAHQGPGAARNKGILASSGEWIAFIDSDDIWYENKIEEIEKVIRTDKKFNFICHDEILIKKNGHKYPLQYSLKYNSKMSLFDQLYNSNIFSTSAVVCKKKLLIEQSLFDEDLMSAQDYDLWIKLASKIKLFIINKPLGEYIERKGNITSKNIFRRYKNEIFIASKYRDRVPLLK